MKILITGIGCIGKSSLRERIASEFSDQVITVDMDYTNEIPADKDKIVIVESVHGLEDNPHSFDKILYLLPPRWHTFLWMKRAWAWFSTGIIVLSEPLGEKRQYAIANIPIIFRILFRNIFFCSSWIKSDINQVRKYFPYKSLIASSIDQAHKILTFWLTNHLFKDKSDGCGTII